MISTDHANNGNWCIFIFGVLILNIVVIKFIAPNIEEIPAKCKLKIPKSTAADEWLCILLNGGYTVHPVPTPISTSDDDNNKSNAGGSNRCR